MSRLPDHPRVCGENIISCAPRIGSHGSPPRVRGKRDTGEQKACAMRITPAHAGKTKQNEAKASKSSDHPRACGENYFCAFKPSSVDGSPPRMRGKRKHRAIFRDAGRITPAHAGKTDTLLDIAGYAADHPRACGENDTLKDKNGRYLGSPPRVRGKHIVFNSANHLVGITPACAGKTSDFQQCIF